MATVRRIDSPANPILKAAAKLRQRRGRERQQRIIIDGSREVERALQAGVDVDAVFFPIGAELEKMPLAEGPIDLFEVSRQAFEKIAFGNRTELVATATTPRPTLEDIQLPAQPAIAVLEGIEKPGNLGAVLRTADAAGIHAVILVDAVIDLFNPNVIRASLGTVFAVPLAAVGFEPYRDWAGRHQFHHFLAKCPAATRYTDVDYRDPAALVLGSEKSGLTNRWDELDAATTVEIPMFGCADSLNVSTAAAVLFYETVRQRSAAQA